MGGFLLGVLAYYTKILGFDDFYAPMILIVTSILPPMTFQFLNLGMNQGFKKALATVRDYPAMIMLPAFSVWTYGSIEKGSCQYCQTSQKIGLSFLNSFLNGFYTLCISVTASSILLTQ